MPQPIHGDAIPRQRLVVLVAHRQIAAEDLVLLDPRRQRDRPHRLHYFRRERHEGVARQHRRPQKAQAGVGESFDFGLGGKSGEPGQSPYDGRFHVEALGDGRFRCTGEILRGSDTDLGPMALLRVEDDSADVRVIVGGTPFQCLDQAIFRHLGVEPAGQRILALKSTVHFRADFDPIAAETMTVEAPGAHPCRLEGLAYRNLRDGVRLGPGGPAFVSPTG